jgi:hypothetical protein
VVDPFRRGIAAAPGEMPRPVDLLNDQLIMIEDKDNRLATVEMQPRESGDRSASAQDAR